jgi:hypothetical protein
MNEPCTHCHGTGRTAEGPCPLGHVKLLSREEWTGEYRRQVYENAVFMQSRYLTNPRLPEVKTDRYRSLHE